MVAMSESTTSWREASAALAVLLGWPLIAHYWLGLSDRTTVVSFLLALWLAEVTVFRLSRRAARARRQRSP